MQKLMHAKIHLGALLAALFASVSFLHDLMADHHEKKPKLGYADTPLIPGQKWRVHDGARPQPRIVAPGDSFSHLATPPSDALILFNGRNLANFEKANKQPAGWKVENGYMEVVPGSGTIQTKEHFSDFQLHLEFATPRKVQGRSQGRGNSGVIIFGDFEIQILDSFDNPTYPDGQAGAMYGQQPPRVNASKPPGEWQSYDIIFENARWINGKLTKKANVTVIHNGVAIHHKQEFNGTSLHRRVGKYTKPKTQGPIHLQDHGNPMRFRNIWIRKLGDYDK